MSDDKNYRHRFTVPHDDDVVNDWIASQSNLGFSLRVLIKDFVRTYGNKDATCVELGSAVKRRGRPPKQLKALMSQMDGGGFSDEEYDDDATDEEQDVIAEVKVKEEAKAPVAPKPKTEPKKTEAKVEETGSDDQLMSMFKGHDFSGKSNGQVPTTSDGNVDFDSLID